MTFTTRIGAPIVIVLVVALSWCCTSYRVFEYPAAHDPTHICTNSEGGVPSKEPSFYREDSRENEVCAADEVEALLEPENAPPVLPTPEYTPTPEIEAGAILAALGHVGGELPNPLFMPGSSELVNSVIKPPPPWYEEFRQSYAALKEGAVQFPEKSVKSQSFLTLSGPGKCVQLNPDITNSIWLS